MNKHFRIREIGVRVTDKWEIGPAIRALDGSSPAIAIGVDGKLCICARYRQAGIKRAISYATERLGQEGINFIGYEP